MKQNIEHIKINNLFLTNQIKEQTMTNQENLAAIIRYIASHIVCTCGIFMCIILAYAKYVKGDNILPHTEISIILSVTITTLFFTIFHINWKNIGLSVKKMYHIYNNKNEKLSKKKLNTAYTYIDEVFEELPPEQIKLIKKYIYSYSTGKSLKGINQMKVNYYSTYDIYNFGWNILNHFKIGERKDMTTFLHCVFENLENIKPATITKNMKSSKANNIKIREKGLLIKK